VFGKSAEIRNFPKNSEDLATLVTTIVSHRCRTLSHVWSKSYLRVIKWVQVRISLFPFWNPLRKLVYLPKLQQLLFQYTSPRKSISCYIRDFNTLQLYSDFNKVTFLQDEYCYPLGRWCSSSWFCRLSLTQHHHLFRFT
jgi:hypothetical protein